MANRLFGVLAATMVRSALADDAVLHSSIAGDVPVRISPIARVGKVEERFGHDVYDSDVSATMPEAGAPAFRDGDTITAEGSTWRIASRLPIGGGWIRLQLGEV